jgi:bla regulator protein BlaR1
MLVEALFWFHPFVWWIGARLIDERERACDEAVLSLGNQPRVYAEAILNVCKLYVESPITCVSGVTGANLKKRIHAILAQHATDNLNVAKKSLLIIAAALALALPLIVGIVTTPLLRAQSASSDNPKFEVASVKPCEPGDLGFGGRGGPPTWSPGRLTVYCQSPRILIAWAYIEYATGQSPPGQHRTDSAALDFGALRTTIMGAPSWLNSERFTISAEVPTPASKAMMMGPMMQSLLEERFHLKLHIENKDVPTYDLVVAKGGPKLPQTDTSFCRRMDPKNRGQRTGPPNAPNCTMQMTDLSMGNLALLLPPVLGPTMNRPIVDKTGIKGRFDVQMVWALDPDRFAGLQQQPDLPSLPVALKEQLGLELVPAKGPEQTIVIDHIEQPTPN